GERVVEEVDLADGQVVGGAPVGVDQANVFGGRALCVRDGHERWILERRARQSRRSTASAPETAGGGCSTTPARSARKGVRKRPTILTGGHQSASPCTIEASPWPPAGILRRNRRPSPVSRQTPPT